jgi:hypothetical protein
VHGANVCAQEVLVGSRWKALPVWLGAATGDAHLPCNGKVQDSPSISRYHVLCVRSDV